MLAMLKMGMCNNSEPLSSRSNGQSRLRSYGGIGDISPDSPETMFSAARQYSFRDAFLAALY